MELFNVRYLHHTESALLIDYDGDEIWLPLSQIKLDWIELDCCVRGENIDILVPAWLATEKEMC